jgi:hypothetical protein
MMHNSIETRRPACERAVHRSHEPFSENPSTAIRDDAVEPACANCHHNTPSLGRKIGQRSLVAAVDAARHGSANRTGGGHVEGFRGDQQFVGLGLNPLDAEPKGRKRDSTTHDDDPLAVHRPRSTQIASGLSQMGYSALRHSLGLDLGGALQADDRRGLRQGSHKHQKEKRTMEHYAGLDVSVKETSICIVDEAGKICREMKVPSSPEALTRVLQDPVWCLVRVGLEAGPLSQWLFSGMAEAGLPTICIETRHTKAFLKAQVNKSDRNDARGIAQMMRVNLFRPVHVKTLTSQKRRALLMARKLLQEKAHAIENDIRGLLRNFGLKVGATSVVKFDERIRKLV